MLAPWVVDEMRSVDLKDKRLNKRVQIVLSPADYIRAAEARLADLTKALVPAGPGA